MVEGFFLESLYTPRPTLSVEETTPSHLPRPTLSVEETTPSHPKR
ncbi:hypothetical protein [Porphyromonas gingivicanis]|nr:hypothetical protein [Porphyromonas gingivicanis]